MDSMTGYTKLFGSIVASTIWREDDRTRIVWITMLALANKSGIVEASLPGLADLSRVSVEDCRVSVAKLESPDADSRTPDFEGRRIKKVDGGWAVLNHAKYRAKMGIDERREYLRLKQQEHRARNKQGVNIGQQESTESTHAESDSYSKEKKKASGYAVPPCFETVEGFTAGLAGWIEMRNKKRNPPTGHAVQLLINRLSERPQDAVKALDVAIERGWATVKWDWFDRSNADSISGRNPAKAIRSTSDYEG